MKKTFAILLSIVLMLSLAVPAMADEVTTYSITINNEAKGHTYEAYQIFTGDLSNAAENDASAGTGAVLSNIQWGSSVTNAADLGDAAKIAERLANGYTGENKLSIDDLLNKIALGDKVADSGETSNPYTISGLVAGYYLIKDQDASLAGKEDAYTEFILEVVENSSVTPKSSMPEVEKKVDDKNDSNNTEDEVVWNDAADYDIGDAVPFLLKATLADNVTAYDTYKIVFHDTLSAGLTYNNDAKISFDANDVTEYFTITEENGKLTISCNDVKAFGATNESVITVEYTANLNANAVLGAAGNPNEVYLEYSNNPNWAPNYNDEGKPENPGDSPTGETPEDKVIVFTYKTVINKVDESGNPLSGADFALYKKVLKTEATDTTAAVYDYDLVADSFKSVSENVFIWTGLDDGDYKLVETTTPAGYNTIPDIEFTITAEHDVFSDNPALTKLEGGDMFTGEVSTGALTGDVINRAGATLPETGGIGTTIFYVVGGVLLVGAVVLLVTKKRMSTEG